MEYASLHARARQKGVNPLIYWIVRGVLQPFFHLYFRLSRIGREHIPDGPVILASNHRSFLDPFIIATLARRPLYYVAKEELFRNRFNGWLLNNLGAFPVRRGQSDEDMIETAKEILARGDAVLIFPEGTRIRPGALGRPRRGVGRLALETGAPVVPIAIIGTEAIRKGLRIRPHKVRVRVGRALTFPQVQAPSRTLAAAVTDRIWPCVMLQWEWLGGLPPLRRAAVIGAGSWGTAVAVMLARAGLEVDLGCRTADQASLVTASGRNDEYLPGAELPESVTVMRAADLELSRHDLVCFAVPSAALPSAVAAHGGAIPQRAGVLVMSKGLVPPLGSLPSAFVGDRVNAWAVGALAGPAHAAAALSDGASLVVGSSDPAFGRQVTTALTAAGFDAGYTRDVVGVELAGCAKNAAALAAAAASSAGPNAAGAAAGKVFAEIDALARHEGSAPETFAGLAGAGDLVATVMAEGSRNRRAGEMLAEGMPAEDIDSALGQTAEAVACVPLLAERVQAAGVDAPTLRGLAGVIEGELDAAEWTESLTAPRPTPKRPQKVRAA
jgi:glycerol-3-phosphate dehydrogenase (NAD(P)+)